MKNDSKERSPEKMKQGVSRRAFLRGAGVTTAGTVALASGMLSFTAAEPAPAKTAVLGPGETEVKFMVNGQQRAV